MQTKIVNLMDQSFGKWEVTLVDCGDGSGDCYVELPKELLERINWHNGDVINIDIVQEQLRLTKVHD